jgi:drug/metabolite transporter (DMT)-like permease
MMKGYFESIRRKKLLRTIMVLTFGLCLESVGNVLLRKGMKEVGKITTFSMSSLFHTVFEVVTNLTVISGVTLDTLFFGCLLVVLSWTEVSIVLPLTAMGYVTTALSAKLILHEGITALRWGGTAVIVFGCVLVGKSGIE